MINKLIINKIRNIRFVFYLPNIIDNLLFKEIASHIKQNKISFKKEDMKCKNKIFL